MILNYLCIVVIMNCRWTAIKRLWRDGNGEQEPFRSSAQTCRLSCANTSQVPIQTNSELSTVMCKYITGANSRGQNLFSTIVNICRKNKASNLSSLRFKDQRPRQGCSCSHHTFCWSPGLFETHLCCFRINLYLPSHGLFLHLSSSNLHGIPF